jgi:hypothetical protein
MKQEVGGAVPVRITELTFLGFYLNGALGSGKYDDISVEEVKERIRDRTIFDYLKTRLGPDIDVTGVSSEARGEVNEEWADMADALDEARKMGVDRNGLCLLMAYILEGIQRRTPRGA